MSTLSPNTSLLAAAHSSASDKTPAPLAGPNTDVIFRFKDVQPPSELYIDVDDALIIVAATGQVGETITVNVRLLQPTGRLEDNQFVCVVPNTRIATVFTFPLAQGYLLSLAASALVATTRGQTFYRAFINRGAFGTGRPGQPLCADYVTTRIGPGYPGGRVLAPVEGPGVVRSVAISNPGAGNEFSISPGTNARWRIISLEMQLQTSAVAGNRQPNIKFSVGGLGAHTFQPNILVPASTLATVTASPAAVMAGLVNTIVNVPLPIDNRILATDTINSVTLGKDAGDTWQNGQVGVEEWLDNV